MYGVFSGLALASVPLAIISLAVGLVAAMEGHGRWCAIMIIAFVVLCAAGGFFFYEAALAAGGCE